MILIVALSFFAALVLVVLMLIPAVHVLMLLFGDPLSRLPDVLQSLVKCRYGCRKSGGHKERASVFFTEDGHDIPVAGRKVIDGLSLPEVEGLEIDYYCFL